jgi:AcrR family transcriptional regulator
MRHMTQSPRQRLSPDTRREQLLDLGVRLFATRTLDEISIDLLAEEAGISRGLLYHYFGNKQDFHEAVVRRAIQDLIEVTGPVDEDDLMTRMMISLQNYVDYVVANHTAYVSIVRAASSGNQTMHEIYHSALTALIDRIWESSTPEELATVGIPDTPAIRLMARGWAALTEYVVLSWIEDDRGITRDELISTLALSLAGIASSVGGSSFGGSSFGSQTLGGQA